ncbi:stalk domain-containing protein [Paenibacillus hodogayensis]|uniref:Stalk domain-containing protein n=1 Tax=Paenibacillus hodogayensis TaxID=279208 RepID=A0ABV5W3A0_9BACL
MKKKTGLLAAAGLLLAVSGVAAAAGTTGEYKGYPVVNVVVNGKEVRGEVPGINMEGNTLIPLKVVSEALGAKVGWDQATATATVTTTAAASSPAGSPTSGQAEDPEKRKLVQSVRDLSKKIDAYIDELSTIRERIRIAKEFYDIKKNDHYFKPMNEFYWKSFEDRYWAIVTETSGSAMNEARQKGLLDKKLMESLDNAQTSMQNYKNAVDHFSRYVSSGQSQFLDYYITSYANAFDMELKAKETFAGAFAEFQSKNP